MEHLIRRIHAYIQDPMRTTSMNRFGAREAPIPPPVSPTVVAATEDQLGIHLPPLLTACYTHIGNGHFGPGYGFFPLPTPSPMDTDIYMPDLIRMNQRCTSTGMLFICDWGCNHYSCLDCRTPFTPVGFFIGAGNEYLLHNQAFDCWLEDWLAGVDLWEQIWGDHENV